MYWGKKYRYSAIKTEKNVAKIKIITIRVSGSLQCPVQGWHVVPGQMLIGCLKCTLQQILGGRMKEYTWFCSMWCCSFQISDVQDACRTEPKNIPVIYIVQAPNLVRQMLMVSWTPCQVCWGQSALQHSNLPDKIQYEKDWILATNCADENTQPLPGNNFVSWLMNVYTF